jgi:hypothetical protein
VRLTQVNSAQFVMAGPGPSQIVLRANNDRVFVTINVVSVGTVGLVGNSESGLAETCFYTFNAVGSITFLRRDYGPLVQGEWVISDGAGNTPVATVIVSEGVLTGSE